MKKIQSIGLACLGWLACQTASACTPPFYNTEYFGKLEYLTSELRERILADIRSNHYVVVEEQIGPSYFPLVSKKGVIYLGGKAIAGSKSSFHYYGQGYYRLDQALYYLGTKVGDYPVNGTVTVHKEDTSITAKPDGYPDSYMWCPTASHLNVLETSEGLRVEQKVYDN